jgi:hypothetical protein
VLLCSYCELFPLKVAESNFFVDYIVNNFADNHVANEETMMADSAVPSALARRLVRMIYTFILIQT